MALDPTLSRARSRPRSAVDSSEGAGLTGRARYAQALWLEGTGRLFVGVPGGGNELDSFWGLSESLDLRRLALLRATLVVVLCV